MARQNQRVKNMSTQEVKKIVYFKNPGPHNTDSVIAATKERVREGDIKHVIVASISGQTALKVAEELKNLSVSVVCVSGFPGWGTIHDIEYPFVRGKVREALEKLRVVIVDRMPSSLSDTLDYGLARYGYTPASWTIAETLVSVGGYGLKTAVEAVLMATDYGAVPPYKDVISMAGSDKGADTAIVARSTYSTHMFSGTATERFQMLEILAMPREKKWYKTIGVGGLLIKEIEKGETLGP